MPSDQQEKQVPQERSFAVITGASSGIGRELVTQFLDHGYDLLICAEDDGVLTLADRLGDADRSVQAVQADLRDTKGVDALYQAILATGRQVDAIALNAGVGQGGAFLDTDLADELSIVALNITSTLSLAKHVLRDMASRGSGKVLVTSSIASTMPGSYQAVYNASKSFLQSFTEALHVELEDTGITVTSLMPGPTDTNFFVRAGMADNTKVGRGKKDDPADVAKQAFDAMTAGRPRVVAASVQTKAQELANKVLPDRVKALAHKAMAKPDSHAD
jgi:short-subunit dehydrogenase